jgi:hypothetical protein
MNAFRFRGKRRWIPAFAGMTGVNAQNKRLTAPAVIPAKAGIQ